MAEPLIKPSEPQPAEDSIGQDTLLELPKLGSPREDPAAKPVVKREDELAPLGGLGLQAKIVLLVVIILAVLSGVAGLLSTITLRNELTQAFVSKGETIARNLASSPAVQNRDQAALGARLQEILRDEEGVAFLLVLDQQGQALASTFPGNTVPVELLRRPEGFAAGDTITFLDPITNREKIVLEVEERVEGNLPGIVQVGVDLEFIDNTVTNAAGALLLTLAVLAVLSTLIGYLVARRTVEPVDALVRVAERVGDGDLSQLAEVRSGDEIGFLADTFNQAIVRLRGLIDTLELERDTVQQQNDRLQTNIRDFQRVATQIARGDLTLRGQVTEGVLGNVVDAINLVVEELGDTLAGVRQAADTVQVGSRDMISVTEQMVSGTQAQVGELARVSTEVEEVAHSVREVSQSAEDSAGAARMTLEAAQKGQAALSDTLDEMMHIRTGVQSIAKRIKSLGDRSVEISEIVDTITNISSQTNLLALNAAIEASGAGAEGNRFGVVAGEVRKLAEDTAKAAKRIAELIKTVQSEVQEAVIAMEDGTQQVEAGFRVATEAGGQLREIATISNRSAELASLISSATNLQVSSVERVVQAISAITEASSQTEQIVQTGRLSAEQLRELSTRLEERLSHFKLAS